MSSFESGNRADILAISSSGGHWQQLLLVTHDIPKERLEFAVTSLDLATDSGITRAHEIPDFNKDQPLQTALGALSVALLVVRRRPRIILSTGAAPGVIGLVVGRMIGARTIWIDSIANVEVLSLSGRIARNFADLFLTQWKHLEAHDRPRYVGSVL